MQRCKNNLTLYDQDSSGSRDVKSGQNTPSRQPLAAPPTSLCAPPTGMAPPPPLHKNSLPGGDFKKVRQFCSHGTMVVY
jgi:hypothetical protein